MQPLSYTPAQKRRASTLLALCASELEAAEYLVAEGLPREAVIHLYFTSFYASQALLIRDLKRNPSHKLVESQLHKKYGKMKKFPRRYVELHSFLHKLRNVHSYREYHIPSPRMIEQKLRRLQYFVKLAFRVVPKVATQEIVHALFLRYPDQVRDISYDIYCPKTYAHHTRLTFWQPPFYRDIYSTASLIRHARIMLQKLRVRRTEDYVVGLNSRVDQYKARHILMLDIDTLDATVEAELSKLGGVLLKSGRGFQFIGHHLIGPQRKWETTMRRIKRGRVLGKFVDKDHIEISLQRGYSTLRLTASPVKPRVPVLYTEL